MLHRWISEPSLDHLIHGEGSLATYRSRRPIAPWHRIPDRPIVSVEHPFIVKNIEEGLKTLGGDRAISKVVDGKDKEASLHLYTRPEDPMCNGVVPQVVKTDDVLLKVTVPKRTGRKRKRGSSEPYQADEDDGQANSNSLSRQSDPEILLRILRDNPGRYKVETVGNIHRSYRYRGITDFQYSTTNSPFIRKIRDTLLDYDYEKFKRFKFDDRKGVALNTELVPPPVTSRLPLPYNYVYQQNPAVKVKQDASGAVTITNTQAPPKLLTLMVTREVSTVPSEPPPELPPLEMLDQKFQGIVHKVREYLELRPIWTRRALTNLLSISPTALRAAWQYSGYMFRSGPWREALIKFGVDPRTDPKYRFYQTLMFQFLIDDRDPNSDKRKWEEERKKWRRAHKGKQKDVESHVFDGTKIVLDGKVWQLCDITDPILRLVIDTRNLRSTCDARNDGWFHNGTLAKIKGIMKERVKSIFTGNFHSDEEYHKFVAIPDIIDENTRHQALMPRVAAQWEIELATEIRIKAMTADSHARMQRRRDPWVQKSLARRERGEGDMGSEVEEEDDEEDDDDLWEDGDEDDEEEDDDDTVGDGDRNGGNASEEIEDGDDGDDDIDDGGTVDE